MSFHYRTYTKSFGVFTISLLFSFSTLGFFLSFSFFFACFLHTFYVSVVRYTCFHYFSFNRFPFLCGFFSSFTLQPACGKSLKRKSIYTKGGGMEERGSSFSFNDGRSCRSNRTKYLTPSKAFYIEISLHFTSFGKKKL